MKISLDSENENRIFLKVSGRIDSVTAEDFGKEVDKFCLAYPGKEICIDFCGVEMMTSAGIREILRFKKQKYVFIILNVTNDVFAVLKMTGLTEYVESTRVYPSISVDGCEILGKGANATVYKIDDEKAAKVFERGLDYDEFLNERLLSKKAFVAGVPTAISFGMIEIDGKLGLVMELLNAKSLTNVIKNDPENLNEYIRIYTEAIHKLHGIDGLTGIDLELKNEVDSFKKRVSKSASLLGEDLTSELIEFADSLPKETSLLHGDIQPNNVMVTDDGYLFIDMDSLSVGQTVFDFGYLYRTMVLQWLMEPQEFFFHIDEELCNRIYETTLRTYYSELSPEELKEKERQARIIGLSRLLYKNSKSGKFSDKNALLLDLLKKELVIG